VPFSQLITAVVTSTETKEFVVVTGTALATTPPSDGALAWVIVNSLQFPFTIWTLNEPAVPTLFTYNVRIALETLLPVVPAGKVDRSNLIKACATGLPPLTDIAPALPKLVVGFPVDTYVSALSRASCATALTGIKIAVEKRMTAKTKILLTNLFITNPP